MCEKIIWLQSHFLFLSSVTPVLILQPPSPLHSSNMDLMNYWNTQLYLSTHNTPFVECPLILFPFKHCE